MSLRDADQQPSRDPIALKLMVTASEQTIEVQKSDFSKVQPDADGELALPPGIYKVHSLRFGRRETQMFRHSRSQEITITSPPFCDPIPIQDGSTLSQVIAEVSDGVRRISLSETCPNPVEDKEAESSLLITAPGEKFSSPNRPQQLDEISILDSDGNTVITVEKSVLVDQMIDGMLVANIPLPAGRYQVSFKLKPDQSGRVSVSFSPFEIGSGMQAQLFTSFPGGGRNVRFASSTVEDGFDPSKRDYLLLEIFSSLEHPHEAEDYHLELARNLDFQDPLLGIHQAYCLLENNCDQDFLELMIERIEQLTPELTDLKVVKLAFASKFNLEAPHFEFDWPPTLTHSFNCMISETRNGSCSIKPNSLLDGLILKASIAHEILQWSDLPLSDFTWISNSPHAQFIAQSDVSEWNAIAEWAASHMGVTPRDVLVRGVEPFQNHPDSFTTCSPDELEVVKAEWEEHKSSLEK